MKAIRIISTVLTFICVLVIPAALLFIGFSITAGLDIRKYYKPTIFKAIILIMGLAAIICILLEALIQKGKGEDYVLNDIRSEVKFVFSHGKIAWALGGGISCIVTALFLFVRSQHDLSTRFGTGFTIFASTLTVTLALDILYRRLTPIHGTNRLLELVAHDIAQIIKDDDPIWIVYPALNIGFYRGYLMNNALWTGSAIDENHPLGKLEKVLAEAIKRSSRPAYAITYKIDKYRDLYEVYNSMVPADQKNNIDIPHLISCCVESAEHLFKIFKDQTLKTRRKQKVVAREIDPDDESFPQSVIIIGDIVYIIISYGMPAYNRTIRAFESQHAGGKIADLITWRRKDHILVDTIVRHIRKQYNIV